VRYTRERLRRRRRRRRGRQRQAEAETEEETETEEEEGITSNRVVHETGAACKQEGKRIVHNWGRRSER